MIIEVLVCQPDGTQQLEQRELANDFFERSVLPETEDGGAAGTT